MIINEVEPNGSMIIGRIKFGLVLGIKTYLEMENQMISNTYYRPQSSSFRCHKTHLGGNFRWDIRGYYFGRLLLFQHINDFWKPIAASTFVKKRTVQIKLNKTIYNFMLFFPPLIILPIPQIYLRDCQEVSERGIYHTDVHDNVNTVINLVTMRLSSHCLTQVSEIWQKTQVG